MIAFSIGSVHIYRYGIMYMLSFVIGYSALIIGQQRGWYKNYPLINNLLSTKLDELMLAIMVGVMVGGRMGHILIYDLPYFISHPLKIFAIQQGGMSFIGGIIGTILSVTIFFAIYQKEILQQGIKKFISFVLSLLDSFIFLVPVGIFFGRFGNFLNQELYGTIVPVDARGLSSGVVQLALNTQLFYIYTTVGPDLRINTNFLSMIFEGFLLALILGFCFFRYWREKKWNTGQLSAIFLGGYSVIRFMLEYLRQDSQAEFVGAFTKSQWFFVIFFLFALGVFLVQGRKRVE